MKTRRSGRDGASGEMAERSKAAVSKIAVRATVPRVRIPLSPPFDMRTEFSTIVLDSPVSFDNIRYPDRNYSRSGFFLSVFSF